MSGILDISAVPGVVTISNNGTKRAKISLSGYNQSLPLEAGQKVKIKVKTSSELIGFLSQETEDITVEFATNTAAATDESSLTKAITKGGDIILTSSIKDANTRFDFRQDTTLDLNGEAVEGSCNDKTALFYVTDGKKLTITGGGTVKCTDGYAVFVGNTGEDKVGNLVIEDGTFVGSATAIRVWRGKVEIKGGVFKVNEPDGTYKAQYLLNCQDSSKDIASIEVSGGTFYGFNPAGADTHDKGPNQKVNYVKAGYKSVKRGDQDIWDVVKE